MRTLFQQTSPISHVLNSFSAETIDGSAEAESDYKPLKETVLFSPQERLQEIYVEIIDDDVWEPDEMFYVKLTVADGQKDTVVLGKTEITQITIINDDGKHTITTHGISTITQHYKDVPLHFVIHWI